MWSCVQSDLVAFPIQLEVGEELLFCHRMWDQSLPNQKLLHLSTHNVPLNGAVIQIDHSSNLIPLFRLHIDVLLLILLANRPIIAIVAHAVHLLEAELLVFVFFCDYTYYDVVVFDENYAHVEVKFALAWKRLDVEELVGGSMQFLDLVCWDVEFAEVFGWLVHLKQQFSPKFLNFLELLRFGAVIRCLLDRREFLSHLGLLHLMFQLVSLILEKQVLELVLQTSHLVIHFCQLAIFLPQHFTHSEYDFLLLLKLALLVLDFVLKSVYFCALLR